MAYAATHNKEVENLMGAEIFMSGVEDRQLQRVDDSAYGVDNAAGQQPAKGCGRKGI